MAARAFCGFGRAGAVVVRPPVCPATLDLPACTLHPREEALKVTAIAARQARPEPNSCLSNEAQLPAMGTR